MAEEKASHRRRPPLRRLILTDLVVLAALGALGTIILSKHWGGAPMDSPHDPVVSATSTTTTLPPTPTTTTLPPPGPGFAAGHVTAIGDSVMLDYQGPLQTDIPGINVEATVSRQWSDGVQILQELKASGQLGAEVIVGLGTNGPITDSDFAAIMQVLSGASRVVFVNTHVDRPWQDPNNGVLANGATRYPDVFVADWASLAAQNPQWFGADGTHLAIDGPGATALAMLVTSTLTNG
jgi:hypothetical protein